MEGQKIWKKLQDHVSTIYHPTINKQYKHLLLRESLKEEANTKLDDYILVEPKKKGRYRLKGFISDEEIRKDIDRINGINRDSGSITIKEVDYVMDMNVRVEMFGEVYYGIITKIDDKCMILQEKNGNKMRIQVGSLRNGRVKIAKA